MNLILITKADGIDESTGNLQKKNDICCADKMLLLG